ncbi:hypothetical protein E2C01_085163 [Portunus trituberculatus]|uniref:Uncharacterized protein n=1 Tax=Portunus trituberculatus TaxID=210409 RepID=A0A5B7J613_PORTR|nr:hypothetical protein [Portunus trituberculatus]
MTQQASGGGKRDEAKMQRIDPHHRYHRHHTLAHTDTGTKYTGGKKKTRGVGKDGCTAERKGRKDKGRKSHAVERLDCGVAVT